MIVTAEDISGVQRAIEEIADYYATPDGDRDYVPQEVVFLANNPHLLMLLGFDEFRVLDLSEAETGGIQESYGLHSWIPAYEYESLYRDTSTGAWYWYEGMTPARLDFQGPPNDQHKYVPVSEWLDLLHATRDQPDKNQRTLWLPSIWTPVAQKRQEILLADSVGDLLTAIHNEQTTIREIPWRQLEELVAELLRARGLEISVTPRSGDGGRDIVARGELIPASQCYLPSK